MQCGAELNGWQEGSLPAAAERLRELVCRYKGNVDYQGFILPRRRAGSDEDEPDGDERLISIQFAWGGDGDEETETKLVSSMFVGTSPEFEFALYTMCFFSEQDETELELGEYDVKIVCHRIRSKYGDKIASAYPEAM